MSKRKPRNEGSAYCDYQDLFDRITIELEHLYHTLWDKRKEAPKFRTMGKQAKTAWMLWKLGSAEYWRSEGEGLLYTNQLEKRRKKNIIYVRAKYENDPTDLDEWDDTLDEYLCKVRHDKAQNLMMPYLARTLMEWRDNRTLYYADSHEYRTDGNPRFYKKWKDTCRSSPDHYRSGRSHQIVA